MDVRNRVRNRTQQRDVDEVTPLGTSIDTSSRKPVNGCCNNYYFTSNYKLHIFFCRQLDFPSEPGVANEFLENVPKSCLTVA